MVSPLLVAAAAVAAVCLLVAAITLFISVIRFWLDQRREAIRTELMPELFVRLDQPDPDWAGWYESHSRLERYVIRVVVAQYLRRLRGYEHQQLLSLAAAAGVDDRADRSLDSWRLTRRRRGLIWLCLLERPVSTDRLRATCLGHSETRAAAARLLFVCEGETAADDGTSLLCFRNDERLSVFGLDTLYRLNRVDASALTSKLIVDGEWWDEELLLQSLLVLAHCRLERRSDLFEWLGELLEHDSPQVRAAALAAFERQGWSPEIRARVDIERALSDPDPGVRTACYDLLGRWGDRSSVEWLQYAVVTDPNERCRLTAARTLTRIGAALPSALDIDPETEPAEVATAAIEWAQAESNPPRRASVGWS